MKNPVDKHHEKVRLRLASEDDIEFLSFLYVANRKDEFSCMVWSDEAVEQLLKMQFVAQENQYGIVFPDATIHIVEYENLPVGKIQVDRSGNQIHLIDICLAKSYQAKGIGSKLLQELIEEARVDKKRISLQVMKSNPARELYRRFGFRLIENRDLYEYMAWEGHLNLEVNNCENLEFVNF